MVLSISSRRKNKNQCIIQRSFAKVNQLHTNFLKKNINKKIENITSVVSLKFLYIRKLKEIRFFVIPEVLIGNPVTLIFAGHKTTSLDSRLLRAGMTAKILEHM